MAGEFQIAVTSFSKIESNTILKIILKPVLTDILKHNINRRMIIPNSYQDDVLY